MIGPKLLLYFLLFLLPTQLSRHFWFAFSYKLGSRVDYLAPTVFLTDILVFLAAAAFLVKQKSKSKNQVYRPKSKFLLSVIFYFLIAGGYWLLVVKQNPYLLVYNLFKLAEMVVLGLTIAKTFISKDLPQLIKILNLSLILQVCLAVYQVIVEKSVGLWIIGERHFSIATIGIAKFLSPSGQQLLRGYGTFPHPNVLSGFCLLMLVANTYFFLKTQPLATTRRVWSKTSSFETVKDMNWFLTGFFFSLLGIWFSFSLLVIVLSQLFLWALVLRHFKLLKIWLLVLPLLLAVSLVFLEKSESVNRRLALLAAAKEEFLRSPLFGIGLGNFIPAMAERPLVGQTYFWQPVHNLLALWLTETGLLGMALACWFLLKVLLRLKAQTPALKPLLYCWWLVILVTGMFDHYWLTLQQGRLLLVLVSGLSLLKAPKKKNS